MCSIWGAFDSQKKNTPSTSAVLKTFSHIEADY